MADLLLGPAVDAVLSEVVVVASEQFNLAVGWKGDLKRFCRIMKMLRSVLQDADEKNAISTHSHLRSWLLELRAVADDAEDVLEEVAYENLRRQIADQIPKWRKVSSFFTRSNPLVFRMRMANRVKNLNLELADINDWATRLGLQYKLATTGFEPVAKPQQTNSYLPSQVIGREGDVAKIESLLVDSSNDQYELPVIAIVGMAGLGKTTLAQKVRGSSRICEKFGERVIWVCVSTDFENKLILKEMLGSGTSDDRESSVEIAMEKIEKKLGGKDYLLILDDVWNEERQKWEALRSCLLGINKSKGSSVLVTTRSEEVARIMTREEHIVRPAKLGGGECWNIIKQRAVGSPPIGKKFEKVGKQIGEKCKGVPLVASLIGATLQNKRDLHEWKLILENHVWSSLERQNGVLDIVRFSYDRLPELALKQCFAFCSIFPKDTVMEKEMLIQLWMAEGFLSPPEDSLVRMEDIGEKYYRYLLSYSLFQEENTYDGRGVIIACKMHDLIHDFAQSISHSETAIVDEESEIKLSSGIRHLNIVCGGKTVPTLFRDAAPKLRTLLLSENDTSTSVRLGSKRLRVLSISKASDAKQLSTCFGDSKSLRYLDISGTEMEEFPKFIKKLYHLQTFRFMNCRSLQMPAEGLRDLINLTHIYFNDEDRMPANLGVLTNLQTLKEFYVGKTKGRGIEELGSLSKLRGKLTIYKLELVEGNSEAKSARLHEKALDELRLNWSIREDRDANGGVLEGLQPHSGLQKLAIEGFGGVSLPSWMLKSGDNMLQFNSLVVLKFESCKRLKSIPAMEGFSSLKELSIGDCEELSDGAFTFQSLKKLSIRYCQNVQSFSFSGLTSLEELEIYECGVVNITVDGLSSCTRLRILKLSYCRRLKSILNLHGLSSLKELSIEDCEELSDGAFTFPFPSLKKLSIRYCRNVESFSFSGLTSLEKLKIYECGVVTVDGLSSCTRLRILKLSYCRRLKSIPNLHGLSFLQRVKIDMCGELACLPSGLSLCTALEVLSIRSCSNLVCVPEELKGLHSLVELTIWSCPKLGSFPKEMLGCLSKLKRLDIGGFSNDELEEFPGLCSINNLSASLEELRLYGWEKLSEVPSQIQALTALKKLWISGFDGVEALPKWLGELSSLKLLAINSCSGLMSLHNGLPSCTSLEDLFISNCDNLVSVPVELKELRSLVELDIKRCPKLRSFPEEMLGGLTRLKRLEMGPFSEDLEEFIGLSSIHHLHSSLEQLTLYGWGEKLSELPQQIQHLTALRTLWILDFKGMEALPDWLANLPSLETLRIGGCPKLKTLPSSPEVIKRLSKLNWLATYEPVWRELEEMIRQEKQKIEEHRN